MPSASTSPISFSKVSNVKQLSTTHYFSYTSTCRSLASPPIKHLIIRQLQDKIVISFTSLAVLQTKFKML
jgi:hypothetical protein